jgi:hypothetical protein
MSSKYKICPRCGDPELDWCRYRCGSYWISNELEQSKLCMSFELIELRQEVYDLKEWKRVYS